MSEPRVDDPGVPPWQAAFGAFAVGGTERHPRVVAFRTVRRRSRIALALAAASPLLALVHALGLVAALTALAAVGIVSVTPVRVRLAVWLLVAASLAVAVTVE